jgi:hypothetical protein
MVGKKGLLAHIVHFLPDTPRYSLSPSATIDEFPFGFVLFFSSS